MADPRTTGFLSTFDNPAEDPLREGGNWAKSLDDGDPDHLDMKKSGGTATNGSHPTVLSGPIGRSYWTPRQFKGDVEVWALPVGGGLGAALETWRLFLWTNPRVVSGEGYLMYVGGGLSKETHIRYYDGAGSFTDIASSGDGYTSGMMLRTKGNQVEAWAIHSGDWVLCCSATDPTTRGPFYLGMGIEDPTNGGLGFTAFGGGVERREQIYRYVSN